VTLSPEERKKISDGQSGSRNHNFGRKFSLAQRRVLSEAHQGKGRGPDNSGWRGGRYVESRSGYVLVHIVDDDPFACMRASEGKPYVLEHRLVMARHLGRPLTRDEVVHHKLECEGGTGIASDNRLANLLLFASHGEHMAHHASLKTPEERQKLLEKMMAAARAAREAAIHCQRS
jgi:hypothetical protein